MTTGHSAIIGFIGQFTVSAGSSLLLYATNPNSSGLPLHGVSNWSFVDWRNTLTQVAFSNATVGRITRFVFKIVWLLCAPTWRKVVSPRLEKRRFKNRPIEDAVTVFAEACAFTRSGSTAPKIALAASLTTSAMLGLLVWNSYAPKLFTCLAESSSSPIALLLPGSSTSAYNTLFTGFADPYHFSCTSANSSIAMTPSQNGMLRQLVEADLLSPADDSSGMSIARSANGASVTLHPMTPLHEKFRALAPFATSSPINTIVVCTAGEIFFREQEAQQLGEAISMGWIHKILASAHKFFWDHEDQSTRIMRTAVGIAAVSLLTCGGAAVGLDPHGSLIFSGATVLALPYFVFG
jgi:hypothetical protein